ncbi:MAG: hypothetical protein D6695_05285 [Planctomycetota bacterium]|nr:MAG: hypothetical protein D6695_05285 [Planctomycetota bacterium]
MTSAIPSQEIVDRLCESSSCAAVWETVVATPGVGVALIRCDGQFVYCSPEFKKLFLGDSDAVVEGRSILDLFPEEWARERLEILKRLESGEPSVLVREIWRGRQLLTRAGLLPWKEDGTGLVCVVTRPTSATELSSLGDDVFRSSYVELGELDVLTPRELAVLALVGQGLSLKQIAERLHRSFKTIDNHRASIGRKLRASDRVELSRLALRAGLTPDDASLKRVTYFKN